MPEFTYEQGFSQGFGQSGYTPRIPPNDTEAEQAILGSMFFGAEAVGEAYESLKPEDFYRPDNRIIYEAMIELFAKSMPVDIVTLKNKLDEKGMTEQAGGREYLLILAGSVSTAANLKHYIRIVEKKSILRKLIAAAQSITNESYEAAKEIDEIIDNAEKGIFNIVQNRNTSDFVHVHDILVESIDSIEKIYLNKGVTTGVPTGFIDFDSKTAGLQPSDLILIAARPSMGKTAFALNIAQYASLRQGVPTAIFSLEMSKHQLVNRLLCSEAMIDSHRLRTGALEQDDWTKIASAIGPLSKAPLYIDDTPGISVPELRAKCRRLKMERGLDLIVIDYLQLMSGSRGGDSRQQEISDISRNLKALAREMEAPVIALSQLSRACEQRTDHRPMLSDLRESGAIEQDADVVAFIYRDDYYNPESEKKNQAEIIIAKQRNGPTGTVDLLYLNAYTKFANMAK